MIKSNYLIAEYLVVYNQDHSTGCHRVNQSGFYKKAVHMGKDLWIGCKESVLRGINIGDRCLIGLHTLVNSCVPDDMPAAGLPACFIRCVGNHQ